jgi:hypothetical protein
MSASHCRQCLNHLMLSETRLLFSICDPWYASSGSLQIKNFRPNGARPSSLIDTRGFCTEGASGQPPTKKLENPGRPEWADVSTEYDPEPQDVLGRQSRKGQQYGPFVPPTIDKFIRIIMRHGQKDKARKIVFDASHALYSLTRKANPRPELRQRNPKYVKK